MSIGKKNIIFGLGYLILTMSLGMFLAAKLQDTAWANEPYGILRATLRSAHAHGGVEAILNIVIGILLGSLPLNKTLSRLISIIAIFAAVLHSGMLFLSPFVPFAHNIVPLGALLLFATVILMFVAVIKGE